MSRVGCLYDYAMAQSFMKTLKAEEVDGRSYRDLAAARARSVQARMSGIPFHEAEPQHDIAGHAQTWFFLYQRRKRVVSGLNMGWK
jgi:hypothetical protein